MNLFLVTSPLQYICVLEAKHYFNCENNILLLVNQKSASGLKQQHNLINQNDWNHIISINRGNRSLSIPKAIKEIKKLIGSQDIERFFYAEYNGWRTKLLIRNLPINTEVYFDDGTLTLLEYPTYIIPKIPFNRPRFLQDLIIRFNGCQPIGLLPQSKKLEIFSIFKLDNAGFKVHKNSLEQLKNRYGNPKLYNENAPIGFIGQGAIGDKNQKTIDEYLQILDNIVSKFDKEIIYFPHRTEKEEVCNLLKQNKKIIYHDSEYPLEIELIDKKIQLSALIGNYSTVMFTCKLLYPDMPIYAFFSTHPNTNFQNTLQKQLKEIDVINYSD
ncbi:glycosyltransferase 52 family protein [Aliivibrio sifiae]|uniref:Glycosyltransferase 52 family protein n=1 Tax=Aliivibrio sifiae TaxID=566293 RepID=A0A2S7X0I5_9GAMM|nr:glycosyltransferase 52 family protein [Aliivibrio sifiae]PQJ83306.1 glycosyltransferase 52 family protein [Aliivibrio sifiae]